MAKYVIIVPDGAADEPLHARSRREWKPAVTWPR